MGRPAEVPKGPMGVLQGKMKADGRRWGNYPAPSSATELRKWLSIKHKWMTADKYLPS